MAQHHTLTVLVENKFGVLARVASLISRRGYNIHSLAVAPTDDERFSKITIVVDAEQNPMDQVVKQLDKLINVIEIREIAPGEGVEREMLLITVRADPQRRAEVAEIVNIFEGKIVNVGPDSLMVMLADPPDKLDDFEALLRPYGIIDVQRTGRVALPKVARPAGALRAVEPLAG
jgi:acetolactate synthase-1/3 small subunit